MFLKGFLITLSVFLNFQAFAVTKEQHYDFHQIRITVSESITGTHGQVTSAIETYKGKKRIDRLIFKNIEGVGGSAGIGPLTGKPFKELFTLQKTGDYDSRILAVSQKGKILNLPHGDIYRLKDYAYFIRDFESEEPERALVDLKKLKVSKFSDKLPMDSRDLKKWDEQTQIWKDVKAAK